MLPIALFLIVACFCKPDALLICPYVDDIQATILSTGLFNKIDVYYDVDEPPTLTRLQRYASVVIFGSGVTPYANATLLGDRLADFVDAGAGFFLC
jgi:hypothetical protein